MPMKYELIVYRENAEEHIHADSIPDLESHLGSLEAEELGMTTREYLIHKTK